MWLGFDRILCSVPFSVSDPVLPTQEGSDTPVDKDSW